MPPRGNSSVTAIREALLGKQGDTIRALEPCSELQSALEYVKGHLVAFLNSSGAELRDAHQGE